MLKYARYAFCQLLAIFYLQIKLYIHPRIPDKPTFTGNEKAKTNLFEVWKYDVHCLMDEQVYPMHILREAIRKSHKGTA
jgi:hypothetical protein